MKTKITSYCTTILFALMILSVAACSSTLQSSTLEGAAAEHSDFVGRPAPAFTLPNQDDQFVSLESLRNQWLVLYFYPRDDTPGCTCQATEFTHLLQTFHELGTTVIGVSPDSPGDHRFFIAKHDLKIMLLSDQNHHVLEAYGAWAAPTGSTSGRVVRSTVLIDPSGRIAWHWPEVVPQGHADRVREKLEELQKKSGAQPNHP